MPKKQHATYFEHTVKDGINIPKSPHAAKQTFKHECDINRIIQKAQRTGVLSHVNKNAGFYADMTDFNYEDARNAIAEANSAFYELDAETRREFRNDPANFHQYVSTTPVDKIIEEMPQLAEPGTQLADVIGNRTAAEPVAAAPTEAAPPETTGATEGSDTNA